MKAQLQYRPIGYNIVCTWRKKFAQRQHPRWKTCMLGQISLAWSNVKNNGKTIGLLSLDNWSGVNLGRSKNELSNEGEHEEKVEFNTDFSTLLVLQGFSEFNL